MGCKRDNETFRLEWKENNDLFKFHEDLKGKRFSYFLTIQTALIALLSILTRFLYKDDDPAWFILNGISIFSIFVTYIFLKIDGRGRDYVDTIKGKLLLVEAYWKNEYPKAAYTTYSEQFNILVHKNESVIQKYVDVRGIGKKDRLMAIPLVSGNSAAHKMESNIFYVFYLLWVIIFILAAFAQLL